MLKNLADMFRSLFGRRTRKSVAADRRRDFLNQFRKGRVEGLEDRALMAAVNFTGSPYTQNFDTLPTTGGSTSWTNDSTLESWSLFNRNSAAISTIAINAGGSNAGSFYSYGTDSASDRALGGAASGGAYFGSPAAGTVAGWITVAIQNNTGATINTATVEYTGEQWRNGGNTTVQTMKAEYGFGTSFTDVATWNVTPPEFDFASKVNTASSGALDGNAAANRTTGLGGNLTGLGWTDGSTLWIRWIENNDAGNDHGLAIDDFSLSIPTGNQTPVNTVPGAQVANQNSSLTFNSANGNLISIADDSATVTLTLASTNGNLTLSGLTGLTGSGNGTNSLSYEGTPVDINAALNGLTYTSSTLGPDTLVVTTNDGSLSDSDNIAITTYDMTPLAGGDIALVHYDTSGSPADNFSFVVLKTLSAGTRFFISDNEIALDGDTTFADFDEAAALFYVNDGQTIPAGTVIKLTSNAAEATATYTWEGGGGLSGNNEELYFYTGPAATVPTTFIYGAAIGGSTSQRPAGLSTGTTFIAPQGGHASRYKLTGELYNASQSLLLASIGDTANNWETITAGSSTSPTDWTFTVATGPEINVQGNSLDIVSGDVTPSLTDNTDFGSALTGSAAIDRTFTIQNNGTTDITLSGSPDFVAISGGSNFSILTQPASGTIAPGSSETFVVRFNPTTVATQTATITIANNDADEGTYTFDVTGIVTSSVASTTTTLDTINPGTITVGNNVTFSGTIVAASGSDLPTGTIEIRDGGASGTLLASTTTIGGSGLNGTFSISTASIPIGTYSSIEAFYIPGPGFVASSSGVFATALTVNPIVVNVGDIAFTAFQADNAGGAGGDFFEFVAITDLPAGTTIYFFDSEFDGTAFEGNESGLRWVAQTAVSAGTKLSFTSPAGNGTANTPEWTGINPLTGAPAANAAFGLSTSGESIHAVYNPTFGGTFALTGTAIAAVYFGELPTTLPSGLVLGVNAVSVGSFDNGHYDPNAVGSIELGSPEDVRSSINTSEHWVTSEDPLTPHGTAATFTISTEPEINIQGSGLNIEDGDTTPSTADGTDFGAAVVGGSAIDRTFTIQNLGSEPLVLANGPNFVSVTGGSNFSILTQPASGTIAAGASAIFVVRMIPTTLGTQTATISLDSNDADEATYNFDVTSVVTATAAATTTALTTVNPLTAAPGENITFAGTVVAGSGTDTPVGTVEIRDGGASGTLLGSTTTIGGSGVNGTFSIVSTTVPVGTYSNIQAFFIPGAGFEASNSANFGDSLSVALTGGFVSYNTAGVTITQDFDGLPSTGPISVNGTTPISLTAEPINAASTLEGWYLGIVSGENRFFVGDGSGFGGGAYSFGTTSSTERAFGALGSGTSTARLGAIIRNTTGNTLDSFTITFDGEQWRNGGSGNPQDLKFEYKVSVAAGTGSLIDSGFTAAPALDFDTIVSGGAGTALNGNDPANRVENITGTISGISWAPGTDLIIRWNDTDNQGGDDGLAIDNFEFSATAANPNGTFSFSEPTFSVTEDGTVATVTVNRLNGSTGAVSVNYDTVVGGSAVAGVDYTTTTGTLNWADGDSAPQSFTIPVADNLTLNANKTINVALSSATGGADITGNTTAVVTILENEIAPLVLLNELVINPPTGNDRPYEFVELRGTPGATLANVYVMQLSGNVGAAGNALFVTDLSNGEFGTNGILAVTASVGGHPISLPTTQVTNPSLNVDGTSLTNGPQSIVVIFSPTPITLGMDLDTNDDGILDLPVGATLLDAVGWQDNSDLNAGNPVGVVYGPALTNAGDPFSAGTPDAATRFYNNDTPLDLAAWFNGDIIDSGDPSSTAYDTNKASANIPAGATLSPGAPNTGLSIATNLGSISQVEGSSGTTNFTFTVSRAGDLTNAIDVTWTVSGTGANPATADDFVGGEFPAGIVSFGAGDGATKEITVQVIGDNIVELSETFVVTLSNPTNGGTLATSTAMAMIVNDDYQALTAGEVVITAIHGDNPDRFSFVPLVNLAPFASINFSDVGWDGFGFGTSEGIVTYFAPAGGVAAGTRIMVTVENGVATVVTGPGTVELSGFNSGSFGLSTSGDSLIAFVGTPFLPTVLFAVTTTPAYLTGDLVTSTTTYLPVALTVGETAVDGLGDTTDVDNADYIGPTSGSATFLRNAVADKANWTVSNDPLTLSTVNFTIEANTAPTIDAQTLSVAESAAMGATVGTVVATDANAGQQLSYAFFDGSTTSQVSGPFTIDSTTGQITVTGALDFETTPSYATTVRVTDNGSPALFSDGAVTIDVSDRSEGRVFIPTTLNANAGAPVVVPVNLQVTEVDGAAVSSAVISLAYDSAKLTFSSINLTGGPLAGFVLDTSSSTPGNLIFTATGTAGATIATGTTVTLANVTFNVSAGAAAGPTDLNLQGATNLSDASPNLFGLSPAVTNGADANVDGTLTIGVGPLAISSITPTATGFVATFNRAVNPAIVNLYDQLTGGLPTFGVTDVTLVGTSTGAVRGSLVFNATNTGFTFIKTGSLTTVGTGAGTLPGTLAADTYTVTLRSNTTNGFVDLEGNALRDISGAAAGDYITTFNVAAPSVGTVTLSVPDFARGYGQAVIVPNTAATGIPIVLSDGSNVGGVDFRINFDPTLLSITSFVTTIPGASADFIEVSSGVVQVTLSSAGALSAVTTPIVIGEFVATVPDTAPYTAKHILSFSNVEILDANMFDPVPFLLDNGMHVASFLGDVNGSQGYNAADTGLIQRVILGANSGFGAFQQADPLIVGDINHTMSFNAGDTGFVQRRILNIAVPNMPALPVGITPPTGTPGADPRLFIPQDLSASVDADPIAPGIQVDIPVRMEVTEPSGISMAGFTFDIYFDPSKLIIPGTSTDPTSLNYAGSMLTGFSGGYTINGGTISVNGFTGGSQNFAFGALGTLFTLRATIVDGATGITRLNLPAVPFGNGLLDGDFEPLLLVPAPTNADNDPVDGLLTITAPVNNPPVFVGSPYTFGVPENSAAGVAVGSVSANDADVADTLVYSLTGTGASNFEIDPNTGAITVAAGATLDFEGTASFSLTASVFDGTATVNEPVTINLSNVNEAPTVTGGTFSLPENSVIGTVVGYVTGSDVDAGQTATLVYSIIAGNTSGAFAISNSGEITVANTSALDFETTPVFTLTVQVEDTGSLTGTNTVTVNLTDVFEALDPIYINEIFFNPGGSDSGTGFGNEFVELRGTPNATIPAGTYLLGIEGDIATAGDVQNIFNLSGLTFGSNGLLLLLQKDSGYDVSAAITAGTNIVQNTGTGTGWGSGATSSINHSADSGSDIENSSATFMLVNTAVVPSLLDDVDVDNDGVLDGVSSNWTTLDSVGVLDTSVGDFAYGAINFAQTANGTSSTGPVIAIGGEVEYVARIGNSTGSAPADWIAADTTGTSGTASVLPAYIFQTNGNLSNNTYAGSPINTQGLPNNFTLVAPTDIALDNGSIAENGLAGATIGSFTTTDPTSGDTHTYTLVSGTGSTDNAAFTITGNVLTINGSADFETQPSYAIRVRSTDAGGAFFEEAFTISVTDVNETPTIAAQSFSVPENSANGTVVGAVVANDVDAGDTLTYAITAGNTSGAFAIDPSTGEITVANGSVLDFETIPSFALTVSVTDAGTLSASETVTINLTNVNEAPAFGAASYNFSTFENNTAGTTIGVFVVTDPDASTTFTYNLSGAGASNFEIVPIGPGTAAVTVAAGATLDFESTPSFPLTVEVSDGTLTTSVPLTITLTNVNEAPLFTPDTASFTVAENAANGVVVGTVTAQDPDAGDTVTYAITGGNGTGAFAIDGSTGQITVADTAQMTAQVYSLTITSTDALGLTGTITVSITVSANLAPTFDVSSYTFSLPENSVPGAAVGSVSATDPELVTLTYSLVGSSNFEINPSTGAITVAAGAVLDFEGTNTFNLTATASDGFLSSSVPVTVNLSNVNEAPTDIQLSNNSLPENAGADAVVGTLSAADPDAGSTFTFSLPAGVGDNAAFNISGTSLRANTSFDFETQSSYSVTVRVSDGNLTFDKGFTISVTDVNEAPTITAQTFAVAENSANSTPVGTVLADDVDAGDTKTFAITSGNGSGAFAIDGSTGAITVANGSLLDFESLASYALTVSVTDAGLLSASNTVTINLTDVNEGPTIAPQTFSVAENSANGTAVGTVVASDVDAGDTLTFAITGGNVGGAFAISPAGAITVANGSLLNFEVTPSYSLTVSVTDSGNLSANTTVTINLTDVNEAPTITSGSTFSVAENTTAVTTVTATDPDTVTTLAYSIVGGADAGKFTIDQDLGLLAFLSAPDFESPTDAGANNVYDLVVRVSDGSLSNDQAIAVTVTNVNEAPSIADQGFSVLDTVANGHVVGTVVATDADAGDTKTFAITAGNSGGVFAINPSSGQITVADASQLDYLVNPTYSLTVSVTDSGLLTDTATVTITVNHINSNPTNISLSTTSIPENAGVNAVVGTLSTTDPDLPSDTHTYTLLTTGTGSTDHASFNIAGDQLRANASFDFETKSSYTIRVRSTDQGGASVEKVFTIYVTNVVETGNQAPSNINLSGNQTVAPTALVGLPVGHLSTSDANPGDTHTYTLGGPDAAKFFIAGSVLRLSADVTDPVGTVYNISVTSTDQGGLFFTKTFTITVAETANVAPTFVTLSAFTIAENNLPNALVGTLSSTDANLPSDSHTYTLVTGTGSADNGAFTIPAGTNELRANVSFDFEAKTSYQIRVRSTDQGGLSVDRAITIYVANVVETGNQAPTNIALSGLTVAPAAAPGTNVGTLNTTDPNPGNTFTYTLGGTDAANFVINGNVLQVAPAAVIGPVGTTYSIAITSTDQGGLSFTKNFTITVATPVNVKPTGLTLSVSSIVENAGPNALVGNFTTTDANASDTHTYSLVSGLGSNDNALFTIVNNQLFALTSFDFETKTSYKIRVRTTDQGGLFYDKAFTIFVINVVGA